MSACSHSPEDGCVFVACVSVMRDEAGKRACLCAAEVRDDEANEEAS